MTELTAERVRELLDYDTKTGVFTRRISHGAAKHGRRTGCLRKPRNEVVISVDNRSYLAHRLAWLWVHGEWPRNHIDHIDGNPANNAIANLRDVDRSVNLQNRKRATRNNVAGVLGVRIRNGRFMAEISINGKSKSLGRFETKEEAHAAYIAAKRSLHPGCTI
jgi:hypothetical protein